MESQATLLFLECVVKIDDRDENSRTHFHFVCEIFSCGQSLFSGCVMCVTRAEKTQTQIHFEWEFCSCGQSLCFLSLHVKHVTRAEYAEIQLQSWELFSCAGLDCFPFRACGMCTKREEEKLSQNCPRDKRLQQVCPMPPQGCVIMRINKNENHFSNRPPDVQERAAGTRHVLQGVLFCVTLKMRGSERSARGTG